MLKYAFCPSLNIFPKLWVFLLPEILIIFYTPLCFLFVDFGSVFGEKWWNFMLLYGSEIWGFSKNIDCLEKIQLRICKLLLKLKSSTPNYMIYGELGRFPIELDIKIRMVSFWARLILGKETKLSYLSYYTVI